MYLYLMEEYYESIQYHKIISTHNNLNVQSASVVVVVVDILGNSRCLFWHGDEARINAENFNAKWCGA